MSSRIVLQGLNLDGFPLSGLAAYGLLPVLWERGVEARLGFLDAPARPVAFLEIPGVDQEKAGVDWLLELHLLPFVLRYDRRKKGVVEGQKQAKERPDRKRKRREKGILELKELVDQGLLDGLDRYFRLVYLAQRPGQGDPVTTPFDTTKGQQGFLKTLNEIVDLLQNDPNRTRKTLKRVLEETVLLPPGDPLFPVKIPRLGWHPSQFRRTADQARIANQEHDLQTTRLNPAAVLLAWEALPLFPFPPASEVPLGFVREKGRYCLHLPTPPTGVDLRLLQALIALGPSLGDRAPDLPVWVSERVGSKASTDDYPCFLAARPRRQATAPEGRF